MTHKCESCNAQANDDNMFGDVPLKWGVTYDKPNHRFRYFCPEHWDRVQLKVKPLNGLTSNAQESKP